MNVALLFQDRSRAASLSCPQCGAAIYAPDRVTLHDKLILHLDLCPRSIIDAKARAEVAPLPAPCAISGEVAT